MQGAGGRAGLKERCAAHTLCVFPNPARHAWRNERQGRAAKRQRAESSSKEKPAARPWFAHVLEVSTHEGAQLGKPHVGGQRQDAQLLVAPRLQGGGGGGGGSGGRVWWEVAAGLQGAAAAREQGAARLRRGLQGAGRRAGCSGRPSHAGAAPAPTGRSAAPPPPAGSSPDAAGSISELKAPPWGGAAEAAAACFCLASAAGGGGRCRYRCTLPTMCSTRGLPAEKAT